MDVRGLPNRQEAPLLEVTESRRPRSNERTICAYCAKPELTGTESPEHALPIAIGSRFITYNVCDPCNELAGKAVDQPWLREPLVVDTRVRFRIPDRKGKVPTHSPLLSGVTDDGRRIRLDTEGNPELLNSLTDFDEETGEVSIGASDDATAHEMLDRILKQQGKTRDDIQNFETAEVSDRPWINVQVGIHVRQWRRLAAKASLALLSDQFPETWLTGASANSLREHMNGTSKQNVPLKSPNEVLRAIAPPPCSTVMASDVAKVPVVIVSLIGTYTWWFPLEADSIGVDAVWVSDPQDQAKSVAGTCAEVLLARLPTE